MKIGYVTRNNPKNNREHSILQATMYNFLNTFFLTFGYILRKLWKQFLKISRRVCSFFKLLKAKVLTRNLLDRPGKYQIPKSIQTSGRYIETILSRTGASGVKN